MVCLFQYSAAAMTIAIKATTDITIAAILPPKNWNMIKLVDI